jgi:hypothetical protein
MNTSQIETLLEKYYEGKTSLQEEKLLREYFCGRDIPVHLADHAPLFIYYAGAGTEKTNPALEKRIISTVEDLEITPSRPRIRKLYPLMSIAATIILLAAIIFTLRFEIMKGSSASNPVGTITDPELAYMETRDALIKISESMNIGLDQAVKLQSFQTGMEKAKSLYQFDKYQPVIIHPDKNN